MALNRLHFGSTSVSIIRTLIDMGKYPIIRRSGPYQNEDGQEINPSPVTIRATSISDEPWQKGPGKPHMVSLEGREILPGGQEGLYTRFWVPVEPSTLHGNKGALTAWQAHNLDIVG